MKAAARLGCGNRYWRTLKSVCLNAENRKVEPENLKTFTSFFGKKMGKILIHINFLRTFATRKEN